MIVSYFSNSNGLGGLESNALKKLKHNLTKDITENMKIKVKIGSTILIIFLFFCFG